MRKGIDADNSQVPTHLESWPNSTGIRRASVNNFGYGGANAHVIIEDYNTFTSSGLNAQNGMTDGLTHGVSNNLTIGLTNGITHKLAHGLTNGISNEPTNSLTNGVNHNLTNGVANGVSHALTNGVTNGLTNGVSHELNNGMTNGLANGVTNDLTNGLTNGITNGVNGHDATLQSRVIILSAKDEQSTQTMASNLAEHLKVTKVEDEKKFLDNLAYTLGQRRTMFPWIAAQPTQSISGLVKTLESGRMRPIRSSERPKIGFVFTGQGAQWHAMGRELIEAYPVFKACLQEAEGYLRDFGSTWSVMGMSTLVEI